MKPDQIVATFSIVAFDPETDSLGVAVQSKFLAVGLVVPWARRCRGRGDPGDGKLQLRPARSGPDVQRKFRGADGRGSHLGRRRPRAQTGRGRGCPGSVFLQQLALLAGFDLPSMGHNTVEYLHTVGECAKPAFADREAHYGDPQFVDAPQEPLLDPSYAESRREVVGEEASYALRPGTAGGRAPLLPDPTDVAEGGSAGAGEPTVPRDDQGTGDTCHLDVVDRHGNMVSATPSGGWLQSSPVVPGLGFPLGAWAEMFWLTAGLRARNHDVEVVDGWSLGRISAVSRDAADGSLRAAANPRGMQGYAVGR